MITHLKRVYSIQFSQIFNMAVMSFITPFLIGFENYGKYASIFGVPGFFCGMLETYIILTLIDKKITQNNFFNLLLLIVVISGIISMITLPVVGIRETFLSLLIFFSLTLKSFILSVNYHENKSTSHLVNSEILIGLVYFIFLGLAFQSNYNSWELPIWMIVSASFLSGLYLLWHRPIRILKSKFSININLINKNLLGRLYEDIIFTLGPLYIFHIFSPVDAGYFRFNISIVKGFSKLFPYKYELVIVDFKRGELNQKLLDLGLIIFSLIGLFIYFTAPHISTYLDVGDRYSGFEFFLSLGLSIYLINCYPICCRLNSKLTQALLLCIIVLVLSNYFVLFSFQKFLLLILFINLILYWIAKTSINKKLKNGI